MKNLKIRYRNVSGVSELFYKYGFIRIEKSKWRKVLGGSENVEIEDLGDRTLSVEFRNDLISLQDEDLEKILRAVLKIRLGEIQHKISFLRSQEKILEDTLRS